MDESNPEVTLSVKRSKESNQLILHPITPKTKNQSLIFEKFDEGKNLFLHGYPGTGKTFVALYLALEAVINHKEQTQVVIVRSAVPSRRQGFLPGGEDEKNEIFEIPYDGACLELFNRKDAYKLLKQQDKIKFLSTSYLRGLTLCNAIVIVDEVQNMNFGEINTVVTRLGEGSRLIILGDENQNDLEYMHEDSCIDKLHTKIAKMKSFAKVEMKIEDICRHDLVKEWLTAGVN